MKGVAAPGAKAEVIFVNVERQLPVLRVKSILSPDVNGVVNGFDH
jgi:hypothetical protein